MHSNDDKCISFRFNADFQAFSHRILSETSRNLSDERLKLTHVNFIQRDSDAEPTRQLSACPAYSGLADFGLEKTLPFYFEDEKHLVGI